MGMDVTGTLSWGLRIDADTRLPWDTHYDDEEDNPFDGDMEAWWRATKGFVNPIADPYDTTGQVGTDEQVTAYWKAQREWDAANPCPKLEGVFSYEYANEGPQILAVKTIDAYDGGPTPIKDNLNHYFEGGEEEQLKTFCELANIPWVEENVGWWLTAITGY